MDVRGCPWMPMGAIRKVPNLENRKSQIPHLSKIGNLLIPSLEASFPPSSPPPPLTFIGICRCYGIRLKHMSLLKDLNPEVRQLLDADMKDFPFGTKRIINDISNADLVTDLSVGTANTLIGLAEKAGVKFDSDNFVLKLYNVFGK